MPRVAKWFVFGVGLAATGVLTLGGVIGLFVISSRFFAVSAAETSGESVPAYAMYAPRDATASPSELFGEVVTAPRQHADPFAPVAQSSVPPLAVQETGASQVAPAIQADDPFGNSPFGPPPGDSPAVQASHDPFGADSFGAMPGPFIENEPNDAMTLRQKRVRLASLAGEAAALLDAAELDRRIGELERMLAEKRADADLAKIQVVLEEITTTFPDTPAAEKARRMLDAAANQIEDGTTHVAPASDNGTKPSPAIDSEPEPEPLVAPLPDGA